ncbi:MAG: hypothetical protein AAF989_03885 [Planctomycetota bacterium]
MASVPSDSLADLQLHPATADSLREYWKRRTRILLLRGVLGGATAFGLGIASICLVDFTTVVSDVVLWGLSLFAYLLSFVIAWQLSWKRIRRSDPHAMARGLQSRSPRLRDDLLSAVELSDDKLANGSESFRDSLQRRVGQRLSTIDVDEALPLSLITRWIVAGFAVVSLGVVLTFVPSLQFARRFARASLPGFSIDRASLTRLQIVSPDPAERFVAAGDAIAVVVEVSGRPAEEVVLEYRTVFTDNALTKRSDAEASVGGKNSDHEKTDESVGARGEAVAKRSSASSGVGGSSEIVRLPSSPAAPWFASRGDVQFRSMARRSSSPAPRDSPATDNRYAANLSVGSHCVEYRIVAGDAMTRWHALTPIERPRTVSFEKTITPPDYTLLPPTSTESVDGDLSAMVGSQVRLTVTFDQPVRDATIRFGGDALTVMEVANEDQTRYAAVIPITTPTSYQVTAVGSKTNIGNAFGQQHAIIPIVDHPPNARWTSKANALIDKSEGGDSRAPQLASPIQVFEFSGFATDDVPVDQLFQETLINTGTWIRRDIELDQPSTDVRVHWEWDLSDPDGDPETKHELTAGDRLLTRFVAIDRKGQRGQTLDLEVLIADDGFDASRHEKLLQWTEWAEGALVWLADQERLCKRLLSDYQGIDPGSLESISAFASRSVLPTDRRSNGFGDDLTQPWESLRVDSLEQLTRLRVIALETERFADARSVENIGIAFSEIDRLLHQAPAALASFVPAFVWQNEANRDREKPDNAEPAPSRDVVPVDPTPARTLTETVMAQVEDCETVVARVESVIRSQSEKIFAVHRTRDLLQLADGLMKLSQEKGISPLRRKRSLLVLAGRLQSVDQLTSRCGTILSKHGEGLRRDWLRFSSHWQAEIELLISSGSNSDEMSVLLADFSDQLQERIQYRLVDAKIIESFLIQGKHLDSHSGITKLLSPETLLASSDIGTIGRRGTETETATSTNPFVESLLSQLELRELWHRDRANFDTAYAADLNLLGRAVHNTWMEDQDSGDALTNHQEIREAFRVLEARAKLAASAKMLQALGEGERSSDDSAVLRIDHAFAIKSYPNMIESARKALISHPLVKSRDEFRDTVGEIDQTRYNASFKEARDRISGRLWSNKPHVSTASFLMENQRRLAAAISDLKPLFESAREVLRQHVRPLTELAQKAADEAERVRQLSEASSDEMVASEESLRLARETSQALVDLANLVDATDRADLDMASAADFATEMIDEAVGELARSEDAKQQSEAASKLQKRLEAVANRADLFESGKISDELISDLRRSAGMEGPAEAPDLFEQRAQALAEAGNRDPSELLRQLEETLPKNEAMQSELDDIAETAIREAEQLLRRSAQQESQLATQLENADPVFEETKTRLTEQIRTISRRIAGWKPSLLEPAQAASDEGKDELSKHVIKDLLDALENATSYANKAERHRSFNELTETLVEVQSSLRNAEKLAREANNVARLSERKDIHENLDRRQQAAKKAIGIASTSRDRKRRELESQLRSMVQTERNTGRRLQENQRSQRSANGDIDSLREQLSSKDANSVNRSLVWDQLTEAVEEREQLGLAESEIRKTLDSHRSTKQSLERERSQLGKERLPKPAGLNPSSEVAGRLLSEVRQTVQETIDQLTGLLPGSEGAPKLSVPIQDLREAMDSQMIVNRNTNEASERLARAARHESRLNQDELVRQIQTLIGTQDQTARVSEAFRNALSDRRSNPETDHETGDSKRDRKSSDESGMDLTTRTGNELKSAAMAMRQQADELAMLLGGRKPFDPPVSPSDFSSDATPSDQSRKLAQTLDELDQQINGSGQQDMSTRSSDDAAPDSSSSRNQAGPEGNRGSDSGSRADGSPSSGAGGSFSRAVDASPTLATAIQQHQQDTAAKRHQTVTASGSPLADGQKDGARAQSLGDRSASGASAGSPSPGEQGVTEGGQAQPGLAKGGNLDASDVVRSGSAWGELRQQRSEENVSEGPALVAPQYRADVEAYFQAIAKQAGEDRTSD